MPEFGDLSALHGRTFAAVIFDNDGTLVDSTPAVVRSWTTWAHEYAVPLEELGKHHGVPAQQIVEALLPDHDPAGPVARITEIELADTDDVVALPGSVNAVRALLPNRCAIATSATRDLGLARLRGAGIPIPEVVVTFDDVERGKPHPDPFLIAAQRLGVDPRACLVVEDAPSGLAGATAAGCATLALTSTTPAEQLAATGHADAIVTDLSQVRFTADASGVHVSNA